MDEAEPAGSGGTVEPAGSGGTVEPAGSGGTVEPAGSGGTVEPAGSGGTVEPAGSGGSTEPEVPELVELVLASVELSAEGLQPATGTVSLMDMAGGGRLDIVMARGDALLVQEAIADVVPPRPRTHDLLLAAVAALDGAVTGVTLVDRRPGGIYVASLRLRRADGSTVELDARPSDALNVALRSTGAVLRAVRSLIDVPSN